jgi:hypothetical protein
MQGRGALMNVSQGSSENFQNLSDARKDKLIKELDDFKATRAKGI